MGTTANSILVLFGTLAMGCGDAQASASLRVTVGPALGGATGLGGDGAVAGDGQGNPIGGASAILTSDSSVVGQGGNSNAGGEAGCTPGQLDCACLPNGVCVDGSTCVSDLCSMLSTTGGGSGRRKATGGSYATGGRASSVGGASTKGGTASIGGSVSTGGFAAKGGSVSTGGFAAKGGSVSTGGFAAKGGTTSTGGAPMATGGRTQISSTSIAVAGNPGTGGSTGEVGAGTDVPSPTDPVVTLVLEGNDKISGRAVSGHWTAAGSPYRVKDNILVAKGSSLTIDPGTKVEFQGRYWLRVFGEFHAVGTATQHVVFTTTAADIARGDKWLGWRGIRIAGDDYDKTLIDHGTSIYEFQFCEIAYVDKNDDVTGHPWERTLGSLYVHGTTNSDFVFNDNWIHHGRSGLLAYYGATNSVLTEEPRFYRNVFETASVQAILQIAHVYKSSEILGEGEPNFINTRFVGGSVRDFVGTPQSGTVVDTWDTPVYLDGVEVTSCGDQAGAPWFYPWITSPTGNASVTYTAP